MNQKTHLLLLLVVFILQASAFNTSKAAYILEGIEGETPEEQLQTWRTIKKSIQRQLWVEGKKIEEVSGVPEGINIHFVPDSLMQAFGLWKLHEHFVEKIVKEKEPGLDSAYVTDACSMSGKEIPIKFIDEGWKSPGEVEDKENNERIANVFTEKRKSFVNRNFRPQRMDEPFLDRIRKTQPSVPDDSPDSDDSYISEDYSTITIDDVMDCLLDINYRDGTYLIRGLKMQFDLEKSFLTKYKLDMERRGWGDILDDFYLPLVPGIKRPHFTNLSPSAFTEPGFLETLDKDRSFLQAVIVFEQECEDRSRIALLRGDDTDTLTDGGDGLYSASFSRGYYSGILRDAHSSPSWRSRYHTYFFGLPARREVIQRFLFIPPFSWYKNLGLGGEFWHPRTTVATPVPFPDRTETYVHGTNGNRPTDRLGIFIKLGDTKPHFSKLRAYRTLTEKLFDEEDKEFKDRDIEMDIDTMIEIYRTVYPENAYLSGF